MRRQGHSVGIEYRESKNSPQQTGRSESRPEERPHRDHMGVATLGRPLVECGAALPVGGGAIATVSCSGLE